MWVVGRRGCVSVPEGARERLPPRGEARRGDRTERKEGKIGGVEEE